MAGKFQDPPIQGQKVLEDDGTPTFAWKKWFELIPPAVTSPANSGSVPAKSNAQGIVGQMATDGVYLYVCIGANSWKRLALAAF